MGVFGCVEIRCFSFIGIQRLPIIGSGTVRVHKIT